MPPTILPKVDPVPNKLPLKLLSMVVIFASALIIDSPKSLNASVVCSCIRLAFSCSLVKSCWASTAFSDALISSSVCLRNASIVLVAFFISSRFAFSVASAALARGTGPFFGVPDDDVWLLPRPTELDTLSSLSVNLSIALMSSLSSIWRIWSFSR